MTFPKDDSDGSPISEQDVFQDLLPRNSRKDPTALPVTRNYKESEFYHPNAEDSKAANKRIPPWYVFAIPVGTFIANKAIQSVLNFTSDTNVFIDIVVVIVLITAIMVYARYYFGGKNG